MNKIRFFKKMNRGIVLGIILAMGLTGYLVFDDIMFDKEREKIKQVLDGYVSDLSSILLFPEPHREIGIEVPVDILVEKVDRVHCLVDQYVGVREDFGKELRDKMSMDLEQLLQENAEKGNIISEYDLKIRQIDNMNKYGADIVIVEMVVDLHTITTNEAVSFLFCDRIDTYNSEENADVENKYWVTNVYEMFLTCEMVYQNGSWKFIDFGEKRTMYR